MKYNLFSLGILALSSQMVMAYEKGKMNIVPFLVAAERVYLLVCIIAVTELRTFRVLYGERH